MEEAPFPTWAEFRAIAAEVEASDTEASDWSDRLVELARRPESALHRFVNWDGTNPEMTVVLLAIVALAHRGQDLVLRNDGEKWATELARDLALALRKVEGMFRAKGRE